MDLTSLLSDFIRNFITFNITSGMNTRGRPKVFNEFCENQNLELIFKKIYLLFHLSF